MESSSMIDRATINQRDLPFDKPPYGGPVKRKNGG
jgi:hypothetical protein